MPSLRRLATYYRSYPGSFSVLRDVFGYDVPPRTLSLRERLRYLESFADLRVMLIQKWIDDWEDNGREFGLSESERQDIKHDQEQLDKAEFRSISERSFRRIAAGLMAIRDIEHFNEQYSITNTSLVDRTADEFFPKQVERWAEDTFRRIGSPGSAAKHPYDFVMKEIISLLYVFRDDPLLSDNACYALIDRGFDGLLSEEFGAHLTYEPPKPWWLWLLLVPFWLGGALGLAAAVALIPALASVAAIITPTVLLAIYWGLIYPETENHVLLAHSSIYLARQWVKQNVRDDPRFDEGRYSDIQDEALDGQLEEMLLQASGRVLHNGFFETNGRPYRAFSVHPLQCVQSFADNDRLHVAADNALNFAWASYAFRSYYQRTYSPFRRNNERALDVSNYGTGDVAMLAPFFMRPRPRDAEDSEGRLFDSGFWDGRMGNPAGFALWAILLNYRPHEVITDFAIKDNLFQDEKGYWARIQTRYTKDHYKEGEQPHYFEADGTPFGAGLDIKSIPESCFVQKEFMNAGGGRFDRYEIRFDTLLELRKKKKDRKPKGTHEYDFLARPQAAFLGRTLQVFRDIPDMKEQVMFMLGEEVYDNTVEHGFWRADNSGIYKAFSYGYYKEDNRKDHHLQFPMRVPEAWSDSRYVEEEQDEFPRNRATFAFYDLRMDDTPGPYVVTARVSKSKRRNRYRDYARGFWELVPGTRFESVRDLKEWVLQHNPNEHFSDSTEGEGRFYIYTMTTGESLQLNDLLGDDKNTNAIRRIWANGKTPLVDEPLKLSDFAVNHQDLSDVKSMPLLEVREVDRESRFTDRVYAVADGDGRLVISNPYMNYELDIDSRDYQNPGTGGRIIIEQ